MTARFFLPDPLSAVAEGDEIHLPQALAHHALRVLRMQHGEPLVLFDGSGDEIAATLLVEGKTARARLGARNCPQRESPLQLVLVQGLAAADKMDWIIQKAVELGVFAVQPLAADRSVLKLAGERADKRLAHWQAVAVAACEQCGRNRVPQIAPLLTMAQYLAQSPGVERRLLDPRASMALLEAGRPSGVVHLLIGPEGGWSEAELQLAERAGSRPLRFGPRVLRTETAGLAALAAMQACWGDLAQ